MVVIAVLEGNKYVEISHYLYDVFIEEWAVIAFLSNQMFFHYSAGLDFLSFCQVISLQDDGEDIV